MLTTRRRIGLCYLARGAGEDWKRSFERFVRSYKRFDAGAEHGLYVIYKGFHNTPDLDWARSLFGGVAHTAINVDDDKLDIGAYRQATSNIGEDQVCFLNTFSELISDNWLAKMAINFERPTVGLVGATGSFESTVACAFPNVHVRSNAFMIDRGIFSSIANKLRINTKDDAFLFESGPQSMTRQVCARGLDVLVIGRNGRGYKPSWWPHSGTFRQGTQSNLLVADNQTRSFDAMDWNERREHAGRSWGRYLQETNILTKWK